MCLYYYYYCSVGVTVKEQRKAVQSLLMSTNTNNQNIRELYVQLEGWEPAQEDECM